MQSNLRSSAIKTDPLTGAEGGGAIGLQAFSGWASTRNPWSPSSLRVAPNRAGRSAKSMLALCSEVARISPRIGAAPHSTVATTTGSGKAAGCMAAGGVKLGRSRPDSRSRSQVLRLLCLSFRIPGVQPPLGPTSQLHGGVGEGTPIREVSYQTSLVELERETMYLSLVQK